MNSIVERVDQLPAQYSQGVLMTEEKWSEENESIVLKYFYEDRGIRIGDKIFHIYRLGTLWYALKTDFVQFNNWWRTKASSSGEDVYRAPRYTGHFRYARQFVVDHYDEFMSEHSILLHYDSVVK